MKVEKLESRTSRGSNFATSYLPLLTVRIKSTKSISFLLKRFFSRIILSSMKWQKTGARFSRSRNIKRGSRSVSFCVMFAYSYAFTCNIQTVQLIGIVESCSALMA